MNLNERLVTMLDGMTKDPAAAGTYNGTEAEYLVFNYTEMPGIFGDDLPNAYRYLIQVHLFAPHQRNTVTLRRKIREKIILADFTAPTVVPASDANGQHYVFEFEGVEGADDG